MTDTRSAEDADLGIETAKATLGKVTLAGVGFLGTIIFARVLGRNGLGAYYLLLSVVQIAERPVSGGLGEAGQKVASESGSNVREVFGGLLLLTGMFLLVAVGAAVGYDERLIGYVRLSEAPVLFLIALVPLTAYHLLVSLLNSTGAIGLSTWIDALRSVFTLAAQIGVLLLGWGAAGLIVGFGSATALSAVLIALALGIVPSVPTRRTVSRILKFAKYSTPTSLLWKTFDRFDVILLGFLLTPAAAADYEVAFKLTVPALFVAEALGTGLMVRGSVLNSTDRREQFESELSNGLAFASIVSIPLFFGSIVVAEPLVTTLYGNEFASAAPLLVGLCLFRVFSTQTVPLYKSMNGINRPDVSLVIALGALVTNIVVGVWLTLSIGAIGVVIGTILAEAIRYIGYAIIIGRELPGVNLITSPLRAQVGSGVVMLVATAGIKRSINPVTPLELVGLLVAGAGIYGGTLLVGSRQHRETATSIVFRTELGQRVLSRLNLSPDQ